MKKIVCLGTSQTYELFVDKLLGPQILNKLKG
jgi:hypothetical protein